MNNKRYNGAPTHILMGLTHSVMLCVVRIRANLWPGSHKRNPVPECVGIIVQKDGTAVFSLITRLNNNKNRSAGTGKVCESGIMPFKVASSVRLQVKSPG